MVTATPISSPSRRPTKRAFKGGSHAKLVVSEAKTVLVGVFNQNKPNSPWNDIALRRAMTMAIDPFDTFMLELAETRVN